MVFIVGLEPGTKYYYKCGDSALPAMSEEQAFESLPLPGPNTYPSRIAVIGDLGLTSNSTTTIDHLIENDPSMILMVGDLTYANQYLTTGGKGASCFSCSFPNAPIRETYQPRWDGWGRYFTVLFMLTKEIGKQLEGTLGAEDFIHGPTWLTHTEYLDYETI